MAQHEQPRINDVRLGANGELEFYDGTGWVPYPDVPDEDGGSPVVLTRLDDEEPGW
ncbi:hypothetical protein ACWC10_18255 [Streptomyces sp. NPDC001595]|uniref:hypothetical protein n=1 Tax=Streptomyces sp. NPDC001532 TaxID=3154520 RepID=UPI003329B647